MVLRSGCIIPFQFRDNKKLLMIGVPEENRNLSIWDLKNVVRAAFGVYNFEFRNKKIGFIIPDELLLNYLAQRHDLTNFVIEVGQVGDELTKNENVCFEPSCSQKLNIPVPQKSNDSVINETPKKYIMVNEALKSPLQGNSPNEPQNKIRISHAYTAHTPESLTQSIDPMDVMDKVENPENVKHEMSFDVKEEIMSQNYTQQNLNAIHRSEMPHMNLPLLTQSPQQQHTQQQHLSMPSNPYYSNYGPINEQLNSEHSPAFGTPPVSRFRRRGERMSKDQKEIYVKYIDDNPCMLSQRRNDSGLEAHWVKLCSMLNSVQQGAVKNVEEWRQVLINYTPLQRTN
ncbi:uncharacterized protein LOC119666569 [Teleopsis dalmanni]|uniref:uncharacterized protein LOC119666569 n=1 Tax=Teleopsis dalmanni TaxID=139649 RepID=UPI0018CC8120|nr:uncharacterized protein LOC119666569 [Teleopsis dalmanni]